MTQHIIAVGDRPDDDTEGAKVKNLCQFLILVEHFAVYAVNMLDTSAYGAFDAVFCEPRRDARAHRFHEAFQEIMLLSQRVRYFFIPYGIKIQKREILELPLNLLHSEPVRYRRVYLHCLKRFFFLLDL
jgi:hypothetical protein